LNSKFPRGSIALIPENQKQQVQVPPGPFGALSAPSAESGKCLNGNNSWRVSPCASPHRNKKTFYGPRAIVKLRKPSKDTTEMLQTFGACIEILYQGRTRLSEQLSTTEWAMIGALDNDSESGEIPAYQRLPTTTKMLSTAWIG
jgi:hypothetical protein